MRTRGWGCLSWKERAQMSSSQACTGRQKTLLLSWRAFLSFCELSSWHILCLIKRSERPCLEDKTRRWLFWNSFFCPSSSWFSSYNKREKESCKLLIMLSHFKSAALKFLNPLSLTRVFFIKFHSKRSCHQQQRLIKEPFRQCSDWKESWTTLSVSQWYSESMGPSTD